MTIDKRNATQDLAKKGNDTPGMISAANDFPLNHNTALLTSSVGGLSNYRQVKCFDRYI